MIDGSSLTSRDRRYRAGRGSRGARIFNATLHKPTATQAVAGVGPPRGCEVPLGASQGEIRRIGIRIVRQAEREGAETLLIGGLTSLAIALYEAARATGMRVVEARTLRLRDEGGGFRFVDRGFRILSHSRRRDEAASR